MHLHCHKIEPDEASQPPTSYPGCALLQPLLYRLSREGCGDPSRGGSAEHLGTNMQAVFASLSAMGRACGPSQPRCGGVRLAGLVDGWLLLSSMQSTRHAAATRYIGHCGDSTNHFRHTGRRGRPSPSLVVPRCNVSMRKPTNNLRNARQRAHLKQARTGRWNRNNFLQMTNLVPLFLPQLTHKAAEISPGKDQRQRAAATERGWQERGGGKGGRVHTSCLDFNNFYCFSWFSIITTSQ